MIGKWGDWGECYFDHFSKFCGDPIGRRVFEQDSAMPSIQILYYDNVFENCRVFCSLGLSHYFLELRELAEVVLVVDESWDDVPYILSNVLFFMIKEHITLGKGVSISGIRKLNPNFTKKFDKAALYFSKPQGFPTGFETVKCVGCKNAGTVYSASFISQEEHNFFCEHGADDFEERLEFKEVDPFYLRRLSSV